MIDVNVIGYVGGDYEPNREINVGSNYCYNCWQKFTQLTDEDIENLKKLNKRLKKMEELK